MSSSQRKRLRRVKLLQYRAQHGRCHYCKEKMQPLAWTTPRYSPCHPLEPTWDHRIPISRQGNSHQSNLVLACRSCNERKGNRTEEEFLRTLPLSLQVHGGQ